MATPSPQPAREAPVAAERRSARAEQRRSRILEAAAARFAAHGFAKTTVEEIAARAGVSKGLVYARFPGKDELFDAVLSRTLEDWAEVARAAAERRGAKSVREAIAAGFRVSLEFARRNPFLRGVLAQDPRVLLSGAREGIVPEQPLVADRVAADEGRGRNAVARENRQGDGQHRAVAVVEREQDGPTGQRRPSGERLAPAVEADRIARRGQQPAVSLQLRGGDVEPLEGRGAGPEAIGPHPVIAEHGDTREPVQPESADVVARGVEHRLDRSRRPRSHEAPSLRQRTVRRTG